jgi:hypothetical protein
VTSRRGLFFDALNGLPDSVDSVSGEAAVHAVACHEHGTALSCFLPNARDHLDRHSCGATPPEIDGAGIREFSAVEVKKLLRGWLDGAGVRTGANGQGGSRGRPPIRAGRPSRRVGAWRPTGCR